MGRRGEERRSRLSDGKCLEAQAKLKASGGGLGFREGRLVRELQREGRFQNGRTSMTWDG